MLFGLAGSFSPSYLQGRGAASYVNDGCGLAGIVLVGAHRTQAGGKNALPVSTDGLREMQGTTHSLAFN